MKITPNSALILVDLQNDFFLGGTLAVPNADAIFPLANDIQTQFPLVIATQDWHPANHGSFATMHPGRSHYDIVDLNGVPQILWPEHCVQNTQGAALHQKLRTDLITKVIHKGTDPKIDSYSTFFDNAHQKHTGLEAYLREKHIQDVYLMGLATDYCVLYSVLDARKLGFNTFVIEDGCFGLESRPGDIELSKRKMQEAGAILVHSSDLISETNF